MAQQTTPAQVQSLLCGADYGVEAAMRLSLFQEQYGSSA